MPFDEAELYDEFARARQEAVELTDRYRDAPSDAPYRAELWEMVVRHTETARSLLESLLDQDAEGGQPQPFENTRPREHAGSAMSS